GRPTALPAIVERGSDRSDPASRSFAAEREESEHLVGARRRDPEGARERAVAAPAFGRSLANSTRGRGGRFVVPRAAATSATARGNCGAGCAWDRNGAVHRK